MYKLKGIAFIVISLLMFSCSNNNSNNKKMTEFLNKQKSIEDLRNSAKNKSDRFKIRWMETVDTLIHDINYRNPLQDSMMYYWDVYRSLQKDSSAIQFSIDSLSKMK